jgi:hypothetical protein
VVERILLGAPPAPPAHEPEPAAVD